MSITPRAGFCCKFETADKALAKTMNQASTTLTSLRKLKQNQAFDKLLSLATHNVETLWRQLKWIADQPPGMRLFRISSDFLPAYTVDEFRPAYDLKEVRDVVEGGLRDVRTFADAHGIRLCTHPGQFTTLCSQRPDVILNSIVDLEYHGYLADVMGYGDTWHSSGYAINIHANNNLDPGLERLKEVFKTKLSHTVRNLLTIENDEFGCSLDEMLAANLHHTLPIVLDIHHHWVESAGEYIEPTDPRIESVKRSWADVRPLAHFSTSAESVLVGACDKTRPDFAALMLEGFRPSKLRAHSYGCWNEAVTDWAIGHLAWTDIEVEAKGKQVASRQMWERGLTHGVFMKHDVQV